MSLTAYPPGSTPEPGHGSYVCNPDEWVASTLQRGDRCWFRHSRRFDQVGPRMERVLSPWKAGTFKSSWFYDGVIANVYEDDPDDLIEHTLFLNLGDKIERWGAHPDSWKVHR